MLEQLDHEDNVEYIDDESAFEIILDLNGIFPTIFDMTSLSALMTSNKRNIFDAIDEQIPTNEEDSKRLSLAYESLNFIPKTLIERFGSTIKILDISHNKIENLDFLVHFKCLDSFIADNNSINEFTILPPLPNLRLLWFNRCKIGKLYPWIKKLHQSCPQIKHLSLMGNLAAPSYLNGGTFYEYLQYRLYVVSLFESLVHLDDRAVTRHQKKEARRLYQKPLLERLSIFSNKDFPFSVSLKCRTPYKWKLLHEKMSTVLDMISRASHNTPPENAMV